MTFQWQLSRSHALLVRAAASPDPTSAADAWAAWLAEGNDLLTADAASLRVMPLVAANLARHKIAHASSARLNGLRRHGFATHTRLAARLGVVVDALQSDGIDVALMGGPILGILAYGEIGVRWPGDAGMLVRPAFVPQAVRRLRTLGYRPDGTYPPTLTPALDGTANLAEQGYGHENRWCSQEGISFDLKWSVLPSHIGPTSDDRVWKRSIPCDALAFTCRTVAPADHLLALLMSGLRPEPVSLVDSLAILVRFDKSDWAIFTDEVIARALTEPVGAALTSCMSNLGDIVSEPVAQGIGEMLRRFSDGGGAPRGDWDSTFLSVLRGFAPATLRPHLDGRNPLDAARVATRFFLHRFAATPHAARLQPALQPIWRRMKPFI